MVSDKTVFQNLNSFIFFFSKPRVLWSLLFPEFSVMDSVFYNSDLKTLLGYIIFLCFADNVLLRVARMYGIFCFIICIFKLNLLDKYLCKFYLIITLPLINHTTVVRSTGGV